MNELLFLGYILTVAITNLIALRLGKEALVSLVCVQAVLVNLFVTKQIGLFGLTATASDALAVGITLTLNIIQEYYQKPAALKALWIAFFCTLFYTIISLFHLGYTPAITDIASEHFVALLTPMPRLIIASLVTYLIVQHIDLTLYNALKRSFPEKLIIRNYGSLAITQLLDTLLFTFLGLYGINESFGNLTVLFSIIVVSYMIKVVVIAIAVPFVRIATILTKP